MDHLTSNRKASAWDGTNDGAVAALVPGSSTGPARMPRSTLSPPNSAAGLAATARRRNTSMS